MNNINSYWGNECIILTRVSTQKQDFEGQNIDLKKYAESLGFTKIQIICTKESGFKTFESKEGFKLVVDYLNSNPDCKTIFITELSRIGRNRQVITNIEYYLKENKVNLIVKDTNIRLFDDLGNYNQSSSIMFAIYSSFAESEMNQKKERFSRGKKKLFAEGFSVTGSVLFGYDRVMDDVVKKNKYVINDIQAEQIKTIFNWYVNGIDGDVSKSSLKYLTLESIKRGFDKYLHSKRNVNKCLKEKAYLGQKITNNIMKNAEYWEYKQLDKPKYINAQSMLIKYPVILSENLFNSVQLKLKEKNSDSDKSKHITILSKLIVCPICNHYFRGEYLNKNTTELHHFYRCSHSKAVVNKCVNKSTFSMVQLDSVLWLFIKENISELINKLNEYYQNIDIEDIKFKIENVREKIKEYETDREIENNIFRKSYKSAKDTNLLIKNFDDVIDSIDLKIEKLENEINEMNELINDLELNQKTDKQDVINKINDIQINKSEIRKYIRLFVKKVIPIYSNRKYTVLKINSLANLGSTANFKDLNNIKFENKTAEIEYYIIINKNDNKRIRIKYFENSMNVLFENECFNLNDNITNLDDIWQNDVNTLDDSFINLSVQSKLFLEQNVLQFSLNELKYVRFENELYKVDQKIK